MPARHPFGLMTRKGGLGCARRCVRKRGTVGCLPACRPGEPRNVHIAGFELHDFFEKRLQGAVVRPSCTPFERHPRMP